MPARSINRCDTISASLGVSFRMGRKNRDNRMGTRLKESGKREDASETGLVKKTQGWEVSESRETCGFPLAPGNNGRAIKARNRSAPVGLRKTRVTAMARRVLLPASPFRNR